MNKERIKIIRYITKTTLVCRHCKGKGTRNLLSSFGTDFDCIHCDGTGMKTDQLFIRDLPDEEYSILCMNEYYNK